MFKSIAPDDKKQTTLSSRRRMLCGSTALCAIVIALSVSGQARAQTVTSGTISNAQSGNVNVDADSNLRILNGGTLTNATNASNYIGSTPGTSATMNIDTGGVWNTVTGTSSPVRIGSGGSTGVLTVNGTLTTGGTLSVGGATGTGGNGTLNIDGGNVTNSAGALRAGYNGGTGTINISNGGTLETSMSGATENHIGDGTGTTANGTGTVNISGSGSVWTIGSAGILNVGHMTGGNGTISITEGGKLVLQNAVDNVQIGYFGGIGAVTVDGLTSEFTSASGANIGAGTGSTGTLTVTNNAVANFAMNNVIAGYQGGTGTLNVSNGGTLNSEKAVYIGNEGGSGTLNVTNGGKINVTDGSLDIGAQGTGTALVDGEGSVVSANGGMTVGFKSSGSLTVSNKGTVTSATGAALISNQGGTGTLNVTSGGQFLFGNTVAVGWGGGAGTATVTGTGSLMQSDVSIQIGIDTGTGTSTGTLTVAEGAKIKAPEIIVGLGPTNGYGTLNIGSGGAAGIVDGTIRMGGAAPTINFNHNETDYAFASIIEDVGVAPVNGSVNFIGTGTTTLTAVSTYTSATNIDAGTLVVASGASIANSSLTTVNSGATLAGAGAVGNVNVASGGIIAPTGFNTLTVKDITFASGSIYQVGINPAGQTGSIAANTATLNGGTVQVNAGSGNYTVGTSYTILSTTGGVTGQFADAVGTNLAFLTASLDYTDSSKVDLAITRNATSFASIAQTANQRAAATGVSSLPTGNAVYSAVVQQDVSGARTAFDALSGEAHASAQGALINSSLIVGETINNRLAWAYGGSPLPGAPATRAISYADEAYASLNYADADKRPAAKSPWMARKAAVVAAPPAVVYSLWAEGLGSWLNRSSDGNAASMKSSTAGIISGLDVTFWDTYRLGVAGGYSQSDISAGARRSSLDADSYHVSVYGGARQGAFGLQGGLIYSWNEISSNRSVVFPGFIDSVLANYNAGTTHVFGETNYQFLAGGTALQTFAGFNYINHHTDGFAERGGAAALAVSGSDHDVVFTTVGLRSSAVLAQSGTFTLVGRGTLAWRHAFGDTDTAISAAFAGGSPFSVTGTPIAVDVAYGEAGLDLNLSPAATLGVAWSGQFGNNASENRLKGQFVYRW